MKCPRSLMSAALVAAAFTALLATTPSHALYKVIGPDGKITYTDRPPATVTGERVTPLSAAGTAPPPSGLPLELRQASSRYPVTLYVTANCDPCDAGRTLLRRRGVPYSERQIVTAEDSDALQRISGARTAPTLTIGQQALRGLSPEAWNSYLDSAGYPKESRLPSNYQFEAATPLTAVREASRPTVTPSMARSMPEAVQAPEPQPPATIKF